MYHLTLGAPARRRSAPSTRSWRLDLADYDGGSLSHLAYGEAADALAELVAELESERSLYDHWAAAAASAAAGESWLDNVWSDSPADAAAATADRHAGNVAMLERMIAEVEMDLAAAASSSQDWF